MADDVFHATFTRNLPDIQERGLDPLSASLWLKQGTGERYQQEPSVYSFSDPGDALRWASKMRYAFGDESSSPADVSIVRLRGGEHWHQDPSEDVNLVGGSSRRSLQSIAPQDVLEVISVPEPAGINEEFQRAVPGGGFDEWIQYYGNRIKEPRSTESERLIELRQAADPPRLPEIIHEPETPRITPGRAFRGLGSLIGPGSKLKAVKRLFTLAQQGYQLLPEEYQLLGDVLDMEALTKPLPGTGVGLDYFRQMLGRVPPAPTSQEEREEPTGIATLEKSQEARRAYDEAMGITKNFEPTFEKLPGEWFLVEGQAEYAEGDIGEYNHEAIVRRNVLYKLADAANDFLDAGINLDDEYIDETTLEYIMAEQVEGAADPQAMMDKMGVTQKEIDVALGRSNATDYGIEELGYVRVAGNNLQLSGLTRSKMLEIANGLYDAVGDESIEGMTFNIEDSANGKFYKDVPFPVFSSGSMKALRDYDTSIVGMAEGGLLQLGETEGGPRINRNKFDPEGSGYDMETALEAGMTASEEPGENFGHFGSVVPATEKERKEHDLPENSFLVLKGRNYHTFHKTEEEENKRGFKIVKKGKRYWSIPAGLGGYIKQIPVLAKAAGGFIDKPLYNDRRMIS